ncbi:MAG: hypothetical protein DRI89_12955 [Bacteroidetes bacterium]|nr:MAG: hypothetical protein DRI89_12955 [Bacteroidota bacterium]
MITGTTMKSMKALAIAIIAASLFSLQIKAQTTDQTEIETTDNQTEWTTGQIQRPWVNDISAGQVTQIKLNDVDNTTQNGYWHAVDYSDNIAALDPGMWGNVFGTLQVVPDTMGEQPIKVHYMLSSQQDGHHGVMGEIDRKFDRYDIECTIAYTDTATNQPTSVTFKIPNHLAKYIMDWDTTAPTPFDPGFSYTTAANPEKVDSILNNIYNVQVNPDFAQNKRNQEEMNETSPYSGSGAATNTTLENISDGGVGNPWNPEIISMFMEDHFKKKSGYSAPENTEGSSPPDDDEDLDRMVLKTANGDVVIENFMPESVVTHTGAKWGNKYKMTISDPNLVPDVSADGVGLETEVLVHQVNDSVYNITVTAQTPTGQSSTYTLDVDLGTMVGTPEIPAPPDYEATNFPNPFTSNTTLKYTLENKGLVKIALYDMNGKQVENVFEGQQAAGTHEFSINGSNYSSGMYFLKIAGGEGVQTLKFLKQ